jgi:hypothetical protein
VKTIDEILGIDKLWEKTAFEINNEPISFGDLGQVAMDLGSTVLKVASILEAQEMATYSVKRSFAEFYLSEGDYSRQLTAEAKNMKRSAEANLLNIKHYGLQKESVEAQRDYAKLVAAKQLNAYKEAVAAQNSELVTYTAATGLGPSEGHKYLVEENMRTVATNIERAERDADMAYKTANVQAKNLETQQEILGRQNVLLNERSRQYQEMADRIDPHNQQYWKNEYSDILGMVFNQNAKNRKAGMAQLKALEQYDPTGYKMVMRVYAGSNV